MHSEKLEKLILDSLPKDLLQPSTWKALRTLFFSILFLVCGVFMIQHCPWYLLPVGWMFIALVAAGVRNIFFYLIYVSH